MLLAVSLSPPIAAQEQKGTLVFAVESLAAQTLDPILEGRPGNAVYQAAMYDSLVGFNIEKGGVGPGVAERWELSDDGLTWTFYLRAGQKFHNGDPVTAHDVKFSLERQMAPNSLAAAAASLRRSIKSIEVVDDLTVRVHTNSPQIGLPPALSRAVAPEGAIMPKKYIETVGEEEFRKKPIGSGPWKFCAKRTRRPTRVRGGRACPLARSAALQVPAHPANPGGVHARRHGANGRGGDRLDQSRDDAECIARRARGVAVPGTMQAIFQFYGTWRPAVKDDPITKPRVRAGPLAGDRPQAGDRARDERQGAVAAPVLYLRLH